MTLQGIKNLIASLFVTNANLKHVDFNPFMVNMVDTLSRKVPKLQIESIGSTVVVRLNPFEDQTWLSMNPRVFVFHKKNAKKHRKYNSTIGFSQSKVYYAGYHHPTHMNGLNWPNSPFFSGLGEFPYHTEFPLIITGPHQRQLLSDFNVREFYFHWSIDSVKTQPWPENTPATQISRLKAVGRKIDGYSRSNYFKFAIAIDNPDPNAQCPVLFGELSDAIQVLPHMRKVDGVNTVFFKILHETNTIKRQ